MHKKWVSKWNKKWNLTDTNFDMHVNYIENMQSNSKIFEILIQ